VQLVRPGMDYKEVWGFVDTRIRTMPLELDSLHDSRKDVNDIKTRK
jgi:hypothetical protein